MSEFRLLHYINQFYGGIGGEEAAGYSLEARDGHVGPGILLRKLVEKNVAIGGTVICGDNEFNEHEQENIQRVFSVVETVKPDALVAGPAFASGRYGLACLKVCVAVAAKFGIPCVTGMHPENPAVGLQDKQGHVYIVPTGESAASMGDAMNRIARLVNKVYIEGETALFAAADGYLPRGIRKNVRVGDGAPGRAVGMLLKKLAAQPYQSELPVEHFEVIPPPGAVSDLKAAKIAIVTEAGVVPVGNPDRLEAARATKWFKYSVRDVRDLKQGVYQSVHGGYDSKWVDQDPDRAVPLDALRYFEQQGEIGQVAECFYVTCGSVGNVNVMQQLGREMAADLLKEGINAVILSAT